MVEALKRSVTHTQATTKRSLSLCAHAHRWQNTSLRMDYVAFFPATSVSSVVQKARFVPIGRLVFVQHFSNGRTTRVQPLSLETGKPAPAP